MHFRSFSGVLLFIGILLCAGCFDITEELWLNKDRSGRYEMRVSMVSGPLASMLRQAQEKANDSLRALGQAPRALDTLIRFAQMPDSLKRRFPHPEVLDRISVQTRMSNGMEMLFKYEFRQLEEMAYFWKTLNALEELKKDSTVQGLEALKMSGSNGAAGMFADVPDIRFDGKTLQRLIPPDSAAQNLNSMFFEHDSDPFVKMLFNNKKYRLIYHLPKKVKSVQGPGYRVDGKTVSGEFSVLEILRDRTRISCAIHLK